MSATRRVTLPTGLENPLAAALRGDFTADVADGQHTVRATGPDPRFGFQAPVTAVHTTRQLSTLTRTLTESRAVTLTNPLDLLSVATATTTRVLNGTTYTRAYTASNRTWVDTTPAGRSRTTTLDSLGRVASVAVSGLAPISFTRDATGLITAVTEGMVPTARTTTLGYDAARRLTAITDPLARTVGFSYDDADRVTSQTFADGRVVGFGYDANGNVTRVTPPSQPDHAFTYSPVDLAP